MMSSRALAQLILVCGCFLAGHAQAESDLDLYTAQVPVKSCPQGIPQQAAAEAYQMVMVRVSGNADVNTIPGVYEQQGQAASFISRYACATVNQHGSSFLQVTFDRDQVQQVLRNAGQSLWLAQRPTVQVWAAVQQPSGVDVVTDSHGLDLSSAMHDTARHRGLRLVLPLMDLTDRLKVQASTLWALQQAPVWRATQRYGKQDDVLMGKVFLQRSITKPAWRGVWYWRSQHTGAEQVLAFDTEGSSAEEATTAAVNWLADQLANEGGQINEQGATVMLTLHIHGVSGLDQYRAAQQRLQRYPAIKKLSLLSLQQDQLVLHVDVAGGQWALRQALAGAPEWVQIGQVDASDAIVYRWSPPAGNKRRVGVE